MRSLGEKPSEYAAPLSVRQSVENFGGTERKLPDLLYKGPEQQMTPVRSQWNHQPNQPIHQQQQPMLSQNNLDTLNSRQPPLPSNPHPSQFGAPPNPPPAFSTSGMSNYQNPLMNQSIGTGAMSQHTGYGAASHHP